MNESEHSSRLSEADLPDSRARPSMIHLCTSRDYAKIPLATTPSTARSIGMDHDAFPVLRIAIPPFECALELDFAALAVAVADDEDAELLDGSK